MDYRSVARVIERAEALFIAAGAGMGVDSGLPDFRGDEGFWRAYPPFARQNLNFYDLADPRWFAQDPALAWGFYGHRLNLYRDTQPHDGFAILRRWSREVSRGAFVFTSNVDGQFQRAGFGADALLECHGSIHHLQCSRPCRDAIWSGEDTRLDVDPSTIRARGDLPRCPTCGAIARPNILMFGDARWIPRRTSKQTDAMQRWLSAHVSKRLVVVECGAGTAVPTVRHQCETLARGAHVTHVRINPRQPGGPDDTISVAQGALEALTQIDSYLA